MWQIQRDSEVLYFVNHFCNKIRESEVNLEEDLTTRISNPMQLTQLETQIAHLNSKLVNLVKIRESEVNHEEDLTTRISYPMQITQQETQIAHLNSKLVNLVTMRRDTELRL
jgi:hypothetical protein